MLAILVALSFGGACADEGTGRSPFGVLKREGLIGVVPPGTAEHEALFSRPIESTTDEWGTAAQSSTPADDVVFAAPVLPLGQEIVTGSIEKPHSPSRPEQQATQAWDASAQGSRPAAAAVFAAPIFLAVQETVTEPLDTVPSPAVPEEATTRASGSPADPGMPGADVVFAAPVLSAPQGIETGWTDTPVPPARPADATIDAAPVTAKSSTPADDVVFATPALPGSQETVTGPASTLLPSPLVAASADAVVFGPPQGGADPGSMSDRSASASSSPESQSVAAALPTLAPEDAARLKARARGLLANGSVASARALLEQAASRGDAEGEYLLAQTYDPEALTRSGMIGVAGDAARAEALYRAAQLGGYRTPDKNARAAQP